MIGNKHIALLLTALFAFVFVQGANSQVRASVYSIFGVGELLDNNLGMNRSLAGTGRAFQSERSINYLNPAAFLGIPPNALILELGAYGIVSRSENRAVSQMGGDIDFSYSSLSTSMTDGWALSLGILPFSFINYQITTRGEIDGELTSFEKTFSGSGGLTRLYLGNSFKIYDGLAAGFNASYIIGPITQTESVILGSGLGGYELKDERYVNAFSIDYGLQYSVRDTHWLYTVGMVYGGSRKLNSSMDRQLISHDDTTFLDQDDRLAMRIPQSLGLGLSIAKNNFRAGFDYEWKHWSAVKFPNPNFMTKDSHRYSVAAEYTPGRKDTWTKAMSYRLGAYFNSSYIEIDNTPINSMGITLGVAVPFDMINLTMALEYGQKGTLSNGLIKDRYGVFSINISLYEFWIPFSSED